LAAFRAAGPLGADAVELDIHATVDGTLIVHHDPSIGDSRPIAQLTTSEARALVVSWAMGRESAMLASWWTMSVPSTVAWMSSSTASAPSGPAARNAASEFSTSRADAPRCAITSAGLT
ncbi:MAG TPA: glycerophosphodiester phosphodiesterase family protein, partial [Gemmatimonadales bacterium]|nr:glycerophosphodiester phosphodiesterase family protein [Gemmatimonadales bacterium]